MDVTQCYFYIKWKGNIFGYFFVFYYLIDIYRYSYLLFFILLNVTFVTYVTYVLAVL